MYQASIAAIWHKTSVQRFPGQKCSLHSLLRRISQIWLPVVYKPTDDNHGAMRLFMWHPCQKDVASCLLQLLDRIVHCVPSAQLAAWTEFNSLSLSLSLRQPEKKIKLDSVQAASWP